MEPIKIKQISDRLYPKLSTPFSDEFSLLCKFKKQIQEAATLEYSEGDKISIARSEISEPIFSKLTKVGRNIYNSKPTDDNLFMISFAIAKIMEDYEWDFDYYSNSHLSYISKRVESYNFDLGILLHSHLDVIDAYCDSSRNWSSLNLPGVQGFHNDVQNWRNMCEHLPVENIYKKIEASARETVVNQYKWDEFDVDGFAWAIGTFTFICVSAGVIPSFDKAFKSIYTQYVQKGLNQVLANQKSLVELAEWGIPEAQFRLGMNLYQGIFFQKDLTKAAYWFEKAAELGNTSAQYNIGQCYEKAIGVVQSDSKALYWYIKAAENGDIDAISNLGIYYYTGKGTPVDYDKAIFYFKTAADMGDVKAIYNLGICYRDGTGVFIDYNRAKGLFEFAASKGHAKAKSALRGLEKLYPGVYDDEFNPDDCLGF